MLRVLIARAAALCAVVVATVAVTGYFLDRGVRERELAKVEKSLEPRLALVWVMTTSALFEPKNSEVLSKVARDAAKYSEAHVTLVAGDGIVVGDSEIPFGEPLRRTKGLIATPEIYAAVHGRMGKAVRSVDGREMLYLARPVDTTGRRGAVRLGVPLPEIDSELASLGPSLLMGGAAGFAASLLVAAGIALLSHRRASPE